MWICGGLVGLAGLEFFNVWIDDFVVVRFGQKRQNNTVDSWLRLNKIEYMRLTIVPYEISTEYDEYDGPCIAMEIIQDLLKLR